MLHEEIKTGDRLEISSDGKAYVSVVEEVLEQDGLTVHMPIEYGRLVRLQKDIQYSVLFFTEKGMLKFTASVSDYEKTDGFNLIKLELISEGERMQRRAFFRFNCVIPFTFTLPDSGGTGDGVMKDICGGGIRFVTNSDIGLSDGVRCEVELNGETLILLGSVLHKQHFPKSVYAYQYRIEFTGVMQTDREKIVQYVYDEQRKVIKRIR